MRYRFGDKLVINTPRKPLLDVQYFLQAVKVESPVLIIKSMLGVSFFGDKLVIKGRVEKNG